MAKKLVQISVRLPEDLVTKARIHVAKRKDKTMQDLVAKALRAYLAGSKGEKK